MIPLLLTRALEIGLKKVLAKAFIQESKQMNLQVCQHQLMVFNQPQSRFPPLKIPSFKDSRFQRFSLFKVPILKIPHSPVPFPIFPFPSFPVPYFKDGHGKPQEKQILRR